MVVYFLLVIKYFSAFSKLNLVSSPFKLMRRIISSNINHRESIAGNHISIYIKVKTLKVELNLLDKMVNILQY